MSLQLARPKEEPQSLAEGGASLDTEDPRWRLAIRVAESAPFANAPLLSKFLLHVCDRTLSDRTEDLTERNIGMVVFQRRSDYKPSEDNIVRSYVRQLRQRLDRYFEGQGSVETWRIVIPRGGYYAVFEEHAGIKTGASASSVQEMRTVASVAEIRESPPPRSYRTAWTAFASLLLGAFAGFFSNSYFVPLSPAHTIWAELFTSSLVTYIVSADSGLATIQELSGKHATLEQYVDGSYFAKFGRSNLPEDLKLQRLSREHLTGVPDIEAASGMVALPEAKGKRVVVRNARSFSIDDMKDANIILTGSAYSTPWVTLFEPKMNFVLSADGSIYGSSYVNKNPLPGELKNYSNSSTTPPYPTYGVIAFLPALSGGGRVLITEGLTTEKHTGLGLLRFC